MSFKQASKYFSLKTIRELSVLVMMNTNVDILLVLSSLRSIFGDFFIGKINEEKSFIRTPNLLLGKESHHFENLR